jgi:uncharacterized protein YdeI (YjbR/CyaY-like superfamily)
VVLSAGDTVAVNDEPRVEPSNRAAWREWLAANHASAPGAWFVYRKKSAGGRAVSYEDAVEEAICFGWIDGLTRPLDADRAMIRFSPRKPRSVWARSNKERVARMEAAGLMTGAGRRAVEIAQENGSWNTLDDSDGLVMPDDLAAALDATPGGREGFEAYTQSGRRMILYWLAAARRPATRADRIARTVSGCAARVPVVTILQRGQAGRSQG